VRRPFGGRGVILSIGDGPFRFQRGCLPDAIQLFPNLSGRGRRDGDRE